MTDEPDTDDAESTIGGISVQVLEASIVVELDGTPPDDHGRGRRCEFCGDGPLNRYRKDHPAGPLLCEKHSRGLLPDVQAPTLGIVRGERESGHVACSRALAAAQRALRALAAGRDAADSLDSCWDAMEDALCAGSKPRGAARLYLEALRAIEELADDPLPPSQLGLDLDAAA